MIPLPVVRPVVHDPVARLGGRAHLSTAHAPALLLEDGTYLLLENGSRMLLEGGFLPSVLLEDGTYLLLENGSHILLEY